VHQAQWKVWNVNASKAPVYRDLGPCHVIVGRRGGLFLSVNWWRAVQARPREFGITVPVIWDSPCHDLRQPAARHLLRRLCCRRKPAPPAYGTVATVVRHRLRR
jgi:hypothetical protein